MAGAFFVPLLVLGFGRVGLGSEAFSRYRAWRLCGVVRIVAGVACFQILVLQLCLILVWNDCALLVLLSLFAVVVVVVFGVAVGRLLLAFGFLMGREDLFHGFVGAWVLRIVAYSPLVQAVVVFLTVAIFFSGGAKDFSVYGFPLGMVCDLIFVGFVLWGFRLFGWGAFASFGGCGWVSLVVVRVFAGSCIFLM
ncbi:hypothetical protein [Paenibacillus algorifonticola]|nr:hypothetical protein [Paenibacillus algorifonticola]